MAGVSVEPTANDETDLEDANAETKLSGAAFDEQRKRELDDLHFESGKHFTDEEASYLKNSGKPDTVMDQTSGQVAKVTNQPVHRMVVTPNGGGADPKSAQYWQGICRRIENLSGAEDVYKWARRHAIVMGRGFWRVRTGYFGRFDYRADGQYPLSVMQQDIRIEAILHQHSVHEDPRATMLDFSDQRFTHITSDIEWSEFQRLHPTTKDQEMPTSVGELRASAGDCPPEWGSEKTIRIAERYYIVDKVVHLCVVDLHGQLTVVEKGKGADYPKEIIKAEHTFRIPQVKWMKYIRGKVLARTDVPGQYIPVVKIVGERRIIDGKEDNRGMVRMARHPQRLVDFYEMRLARAVDLGSEGIWLASYRAVNDTEQPIYANAHKDHPALLRFNDVDETGQLPIAAPVFIHATPQIQHLVIAAQRASMGLRGALGVPDVTPDESRPEQSGRAIRARQVEQSQATSHYGDATKAGVRLTGMIIISQGREIYDAPRILRINGKDEKEIDLLVGKGDAAMALRQQRAADMKAKGAPPQAIAMALQEDEQQLDHMLDVGVGEFDVTVTGGKLKDTQRQETSEVLTSIMPMLPPPMAVKAAGALVRTVDGLGDLADTLAPPDDAGTVPAEVLEQLKQQATEEIQKRDQKIGELQSAIDGQVVQNESREKIAKYETDAKVEIETRKLSADVALEQERQRGETQRADIARMQAENVARLTPQQPNASPEFGR